MKFQVHWIHVALISAVLGACTLFSNNLATFTGGGITTADFKKAIEQLGPQGERIKKDDAIKEKFLDHLVNQQLIESKAKTDKFDKSKEFLGKMEPMSSITSKQILPMPKQKSTSRKTKVSLVTSKFVPHIFFSKKTKRKQEKYWLRRS